MLFSMTLDDDDLSWSFKELTDHRYMGHGLNMYFTDMWAMDQIYCISPIFGTWIKYAFHRYMGHGLNMYFTDICGMDFTDIWCMDQICISLIYRPWIKYAFHRYMGQGLNMYFTDIWAMD